MRLNHRIIAGGLLLAIITAGLVPFYLNKQRVSKRPVIYVATPVPRLEILPVYLSIVRGYFDEAGLEVQVVNTDSSDRDWQKPGVLHTCSLEDLLYSRIFFGEKQVAVATLTEHEYALLLGRKPELFTWEKTKQKAIITAEPTSATTAVLEAALRDNGVYPYREAVLIVNIPERLRIPVFLAGTGDYIVLPEPAATSLTRAKKAFFAAPLSSGKPLCLTVLAAPENWAAENGSILAAFSRALARAKTDLYHRPAAEIAWILGPYFPQMSLPGLESIVTRGQKEHIWNSGSKANPAHFYRLQEVLQQAGELPRPVTYTEIFWGPKPTGSRNDQSKDSPRKTRR
ncbi:MAG: ABC transporter substrate-binding protein [Bacillota bacterium]